MRKNIGFTLAETLIVMGIIGVVAALTLPNLNNSTANKEKVTKLKKVYANLNDAFGRATAVYGPVDEWFSNVSGTSAQSIKLSDRMSEFLKVSKTCEKGAHKGCFAGDCSTERTGISSFCPNDTSVQSYILADGTSIVYYVGYPNCNFTSLNICGRVMVDIDGPNNGKYTDGLDIFYFHLTKNGVVPYGENDSETNWGLNCFDFGDACAAWVIHNENMDYLQANASGKCNNSDKILNDSNTTCK